jgi:signal transduction histidine kinase
MSSIDRRTRYASVTAGARVITLVVLAPSVAITQEYGAIISVILLAAVWMAGIFVDTLPRAAPMPALVVESSMVTFVVMLAADATPVLLPALAIPPFIGGLVRGTRGGLEVLGAELVVAISVIIASSELGLTDRLGAQLFGAMTAGLGLSSIAAIIHDSRSTKSDTSSSYRDARELLGRLRDLSGSLVGGLDSVRISTGILDLAREELPFTGAVVYVETPHGFAPLIEGDVTDEGADNTEVLREVFRTGRPVISGPWVGVPLVTDAGVVAAITGGLMPGKRSAPGALLHTLDHLVRVLEPEALQLDTSLLFTALRDEATAEERRRLARDLHDGVAQDLASLGYLIDEIADSSTEPVVVEQCRDLRTELSRVVADLRRSVFLLRNEASTQTLGETVQALGAHIESRSGIEVVVSLNEGSKRLRPDIEAELLRIAQEGMNNAARHAAASRIEVEVAVQAPDAMVRVVDNGRGLQPGRDDSHGVRIMRERARRIGATLVLHSPEHDSGTELRVVLGASTTWLEGPGNREGIAS